MTKKDETSTQGGAGDSRTKFLMVVELGGAEHFEIRNHQLLKLDSAEIEDRHFAAPSKERPLWWHSRKGADRVGKRLMAEHGWDGVRVVEYRLPDFVGNGKRFTSGVGAGPDTLTSFEGMDGKADNKTRPYNELRRGIEVRGGTMVHSRRGVKGGTWTVTLGGKSARFPCTGVSHRQACMIRW